MGLSSQTLRSFKVGNFTASLRLLKHLCTLVEWPPLITDSCTDIASSVPAGSYYHQTVSHIEASSLGTSLRETELTEVGNETFIDGLFKLFRSQESTGFIMEITLGPSIALLKCQDCCHLGSSA